MSVELYVVKAGDTLRSIANRIYGDSMMWQEIARINDIRDPKRVQVGDVIRLP